MGQDTSHAFDPNEQETLNYLGNEQQQLKAWSQQDWKEIQNPRHPDDVIKTIQQTRLRNVSGQWLACVRHPKATPRPLPPRNSAVGPWQGGGVKPRRLFGRVTPGLHEIGGGLVPCQAPRRRPESRNGAEKAEMRRETWPLKFGSLPSLGSVFPSFHNIT